MKGLAGLIKIQEINLENCRKLLVQIEDQKYMVERHILDLSESIRLEGDLRGDTLEAIAAFSLFLAATMTRKQTLQARADVLDGQVEAAREAVAEAFRELKKFETARRIEQDREALRARRREQSTMDEVARAIHRRRDTTPSG